ncbi:hypothetical protein RDI58_014895 [Solanum bulbocastanum]|uniref:Uncharacterized protein n=1 Tax=Solanum bulbocastanum TaxID=147425 RepID=A0AAN8YB03_SOLBU
MSLQNRLLLICDKNQTICVDHRLSINVRFSSTGGGIVHRLNSVPIAALHKGQSLKEDCEDALYILLFLGHM